MRLRRTWFSLTGCMTRRKFVQAQLGLFAAALFLSPLLFVLFVVAAGAVGLEQGEPGFDAVGILYLVAVSVPFLWAAAAPMVKRCRDAGLPPLALLGAIFFMPILDRALLAPEFNARLPWPVDWMTPISGAVIASAWLLMVCMPCRYVVRETTSGARSQADGVVAG
jgi:uncharacterized membrane protein YhaH (DUF805 family)